MIIIDGNSLAARCFYATHYNAPKFVEEDFTGAFIKSLLRVLTDLQEHDNRVLICLDSRSWRKDDYPEYKENRKETKDRNFYYEYINSFENVCAEMKSILPFAFVQKEKYEADDLVAYYARPRAGAGAHIIVSSDKDLKQLINNTVSFYSLVTDTFTRLEDPELFLHTLICMGDKTDNIFSVVPRNKDGKPKFRFGEKTILAQYNRECRCNINTDFLDGLTAKKHKDPEDAVTAEDIKAVYTKYNFNKLMIDLSESPVHKENFKTEFELNYNKLEMHRFMQKYLGSAMYENQIQRIEMLMEHFFN